MNTAGFIVIGIMSLVILWGILVVYGPWAKATQQSDLEALRNDPINPSSPSKERPA